MATPIEITFRGIPSSEWIERDVRRRADRLRAHYPNIMAWHVVVDRPHRHHLEGNHFRLRLEVSVPGAEIAVSHEANLHRATRQLGEEEWVKQFEVEGMRKDLRLVIREAFDVARRRMQDFCERRRELKLTGASRRRPTRRRASPEAA